MRKLKLVLLSLIITVSFQGKAQGTSTVIVSGKRNALTISIETVKPDYSVDLKEYKLKEKNNLFVEIKKELDFWINQGYTINQTNSNGGESLLEYRYTYILIKEE